MLALVRIIRVLILMLAQPSPCIGLKCAAVTAPDLGLLMISLFVLTQQSIVLKFTGTAATGNHLLLLDMRTLIVYPQFGRIDVVKRALGTLIMTFRVSLPVHSQ